MALDQLAPGEREKSHIASVTLTTVSPAIATEDRTQARRPDISRPHMEADMQFKLGENTESIQVFFKAGQALNVGDLELSRIKNGQLIDQGPATPTATDYYWNGIALEEGDTSIQLQIYWRVFDAQGHNGPYAASVTVRDQNGDHLPGSGNTNPSLCPGQLGEGDAAGVDRQYKAISVW